VCQDHASAAISLQTELVHSSFWLLFVNEELHVGFIFIANNFAAGKTTNGDDHESKLLLWSELKF
jgi:hypothetical protein